MRPAVLAFLALFACVAPAAKPVPAQEPSGATAQEQGDFAAFWRGEEEALVRLYRELHQAPELSYHEERTAAKLALELDSLGFTVQTRIGGHGLVGELENGEGPTVLVRCDMDALPVAENTGLPYASTVHVEREGGEVGVMHACGHDVHMSVWTGVARYLSRHRETWRGRLLFLAQPAEEVGAGARAMLGDGLYERFGRPDFTLALHVSGDLPAGKIGWCPGYSMANVDSVDILVKGKGGHGSAPHTTKDPIALAARIVMGLQTIVSREVKPIEDAVVTVGSIHGGSKHNIIPNEVRLQITVRSYKEEVRQQVLRAIERVAVNEARAAGFPEDLLPEMGVREHEHTPASYNDPELVGRVNGALAAALGPDALIRSEPSMGGEDFGRYAPAAGCPGYMFWLGSISEERWAAAQLPGAAPLPSLHTDAYAPLPEPTLRTGVHALSAAVLELLETE